MLQLYGNLRSRAMRCLWMLEEIGRPYQLIDKSTAADDLQTADYLRLNPNARIPSPTSTSPAYSSGAKWRGSAYPIILRSNDGWTAVWLAPLTGECVIGADKIVQRDVSSRIKS
jgi:hypothetical protein